MQHTLTRPIAIIAIMVAVFSSNKIRSEERVSFARQIKPILQAHCMGCHQPASLKGGFDLSSYASLLVAGDTGEASIVPGDAASSYLFQLIKTNEDGQAEMPIDGPALSQRQISLIERWIQEGAINDSPVRIQYSPESPPKYSHLPVITSLDYSNDGKLIAVSGFNEVLLIEPENQQIVNRLIGLSSRIESVKFSPDGKRLAVAGGTPGEFGEIQIWHLADVELKLSKTFPGDCALGVNWSPDGKLVSFGLPDTTVRCIDAQSGEQTLFQSAHEDWVRDTVFSVDGKRLVSVGRDTTCKLIDVENGAIYR